MPNLIQLARSNKSLTVILLIALISAIIGLIISQQQRNPPVPEYLNTIGGNFTVISADGNVSLSDFANDIVLIYFGYAHCPDVCPMALTQIGNAMHSLPESLQKHMHGIFISLDPRRDTPVSLSDYAHFFGPNIIGTTADADTLSQIAYSWRVDYAVPDAAADSHYTVEHSNFIYLVNKQGRVVSLFDERTQAKEIADAMALWFNTNE